MKVICHWRDVEGRIRRHNRARSIRSVRSTSRLSAKCTRTTWRKRRLQGKNSFPSFLPVLSLRYTALTTPMLC